MRIARLVLSSLFLSAAASAGDAGSDGTAAAAARAVMMTDGCTGSVFACATEHGYPPARRMLAYAGRMAGRGWPQIKVEQRLKARVGPRRTIDTEIVSLGGSAPAGNPGAAVRVIVFSDFECPACARMSAAVAAAAARLGDKAAFYEKQFPLKSHPNSLEAAKAALFAADRGRYWDVAPRLHAAHADLSPAAIRRLLAESGLAPDDFEEIRRSQTLRDRIARDKMEGLIVGVDATPTLFINGREYTGDPEPDDIVDFVEEELERGGTDGDFTRSPSSGRGASAPVWGGGGTMRIHFAWRGRGSPPTPREKAAL